MQIKKVHFNLELLTESHADEIPLAYISSFTDHPWHEEFECICGAGPYSLGCQRTNDENLMCEEFQTEKVFLIKRNDGKCIKCGESLRESLQPIFTHKSVKEDYLETMKKPGFYGVVAIRFGKLVGFCWGYDYPIDHPPKTGSTWYKEAVPLIEKESLNPNEIFYHNESGTLYEHRSLGIGTEILRMMLEGNKENHKSVVFRTINPAMIRCYEKAFGFEKGNLKPRFKDPNPNKRQQWYVINLNGLK